MINFVSSFDIIILVAIFFSAVFSYRKGFVQETLHIASWASSIILIKWTFIYFEMGFIKIIGEQSTLTTVLSYVVNFVVMIFIMSYIVKKISRKIHATDFKHIDKSLGIIFGIARGILIMSVVYLGLLWLMPSSEKRPNWMKNSRSKPVLSVSLKVVLSVFPENPQFNNIKKIVNSDYSNNNDELFESLSRPKVETKTDNMNGYSSNEIDDMNKHINQLEQLNQFEKDMK